MGQAAAAARASPAGRRLGIRAAGQGCEKQFSGPPLVDPAKSLLRERGSHTAHGEGQIRVHGVHAMWTETGAGLRRARQALMISRTCATPWAEAASAVGPFALISQTPGQAPPSGAARPLSNASKSPSRYMANKRA